MREIPSEPDRLIVAGEFPGFSAEELFECWTNPEKLVLWWPQMAQVEPGVGGEYRFSWQDTALYGRYTAFERGRHLGFTWAWTSNPNDCQPLQVDVWFRDIDDGARMAVHHGPYCDAEEDHTARAGHLEGWIHFGMRLEGLKMVDQMPAS
ncbi:hypothetical protein BH11ARM2_BH11ARM2_25430 [soil metagenome]